MVRKILISFLCLCFVRVVFGQDCGSQVEKFVPIDNSEINTGLYSEKLYVNQLSKFMEGGEWASHHPKSKDFFVSGTSFCSSEFLSDLENNKYGPYCWCKIKQIDGTNILSDWAQLKHYNTHTFHEEKYKDKQMAEMQKWRIDEENQSDCMKNCPEYCRKHISKQREFVRGYYMCADALYKTSNVTCSINHKIIKVIEIRVFDDVAEIVLQNNEILMKRDKTTTDLMYTGTYQNDELYLKIVKTAYGVKYLIGQKTYLMEECS